MTRNRAILDETQFADVCMVTAGKHNLAIVEERKAPATHRWLQTQYKLSGQNTPYVVAWEGAEGPEVVVFALGYYRKYRDLLRARGTYTRHEFQIEMGLLIGYEREACEAFARFPVHCDCSKCGGPDTIADRLARDAWIGRTTENVYR